MKTKYSQFLKSVFFSSVAALIPSKSDAITYNLSKLSNENDVKEISHKKIIDLTPKLLIKLNNDNTYLTMQHRSHRSHRSHSSHSSHYSSSTYRGSTTTTTTNETNYSTPTNSQRNKVNTYTNSQESVTEYKLGDRLLKKGMNGSDVKELIDLLVNKGFFLKIESDTTGYKEFTLEVEKSVENFQKANSLTPDGVVGSKTVMYLKN